MIYQNCSTAIKLYLLTPNNFSLKSTLYSHSWSDLRPFELAENPLSLSYVCKTSANSINLLRISVVKDQKMEIATDSNLNDQVKKQILKTVKRMFRFEEDYSEFYKLVEKSKELIPVASACIKDNCVLFVVTNA